MEGSPKSLIMLLFPQSVLTDSFSLIFEIRKSICIAGCHISEVREDLTITDFPASFYSRSI